MITITIKVVILFFLATPFFISKTSSLQSNLMSSSPLPANTTIPSNKISPLTDKRVPSLSSQLNMLPVDKKTELKPAPIPTKNTPSNTKGSSRPPLSGNCSTIVSLNNGLQ
ncbi:MAG: hypothetical protein WBQ73_00370 [Candidatus Babeliales bacterium]